MVKKLVYLNGTTLVDRYMSCDGVGDYWFEQDDLYLTQVCLNKKDFAIKDLVIIDYYEEGRLIKRDVGTPNLTLKKEKVTFSNIRTTWFVSDHSSH